MAEASDDPSRPARRKNNRITPTQIQTLYTGLQNGLNLKQAALNANVSYSWAKYHLAKQPAGSRAFREKQIESRIGGPIPLDRVCDRAKRALEDFDYFRMVYLGHMPTPWQREAAEQIAGLLATDEKEYVVLNMPPGSGKSTMLHDVAAWMTVRDRGIRGLMGAATSRKANQFLSRLRRTLERVTPVKANDDAKRRGVACDAESTLAKDFGLFKPPVGGDLWRADAFVVLQHGDELIDEKEPTWSAYGMDQDFLGGRFDLVLWDDLVTKKTLKTAEAIEAQRDWYDSEAESRLEPGGAFFLVGQRLDRLDLYRYALDKKLLPEDDEELEAIEALDQFDRKAALANQAGQYRHIVYKAHDESRCQQQHKRTDPYWPEGCLLDPFRLTWRELRGIRANNPQKYATVYQQEDSDPKAAFVKSVWVTGGTDPDEGTHHPGCWDNDRGLYDLPSGLVGPKFFFATVDPSPTKMWAIQSWCYAPEASHQLFLLDTIRRSMPGNELLDWNNNTQQWYGVMEEWQNRSVEAGWKINDWIIEINAAQRFLLQYDHVRRWMSHHRVNIRPHETTLRKSDDELGVDMIRDWWRHGRIRLPGKGLSARTAALKLVEEVVNYGGSLTDDQAMACWFGIKALPDLSAGWDVKEVPRFGRPSWLKVVA